MHRCGKFARARPATNGLGEIWETQQAEHPEDWLLSMEIFEILDATDQQRELKTADREVSEREESEDERSLDTDQLGIPVGRLPQETGIPGGVSKRRPSDCSRFAVRSAGGVRRVFRTRRPQGGGYSYGRLSFRAKLKNL